MKLKLLLLAIFSVECLDAACDKGAYEWGVSQNEKDQIVGLHNDFRLMVAQGKVPGQPRGVNLKRLKWDNNLAAAAQNIANSCEYAHKPVSDGRWWWVGQNLYTSWATNYAKGSDWKGAVASWTNEYKNYKFGSGFSQNTGHYTQVVWADTEYVGCGYIHYPTSGGYPYQKLYVCNYGPGGNIQGQNPYRVGSSGCDNLC